MPAWAPRCWSATRPASISRGCSAGFGVIAWEFLNPVTLLHRSLVFGTLFAGGLAWITVLAVFLFDLTVSPRGWCGHLCPVGAFYGLVGRAGLLKVSARRRSACDLCMDCYHVCPEPHVISPALKGRGPDASPLIRMADCTTCGRCIDICPQDVFEFAHRFDHRTEAGRAAGPK